MKGIIIVGLLVICLILAVVVIAIFWPRYETKFFEIGLLGKDKIAEGYYPNDSSTIPSNSTVKWYIYLHNHMGDVENISVKVKLLNSTMQKTNDAENVPSPVPPILEFPATLSVNETLYIPFSWSILQVISKDDSIVLNSLMVNDETFKANVPSGDSLFTLTFELWVYDHNSHDYRFGWDYGGEFSSASVNISFKANSILS